jgi:hypothetical protein
MDKWSLTRLRLYIVWARLQTALYKCACKVVIRYLAWRTRSSVADTTAYVVGALPAESRSRASRLMKDSM